MLPPSPEQGEVEMEADTGIWAVQPYIELPLVTLPQDLRLGELEWSQLTTQRALELIGDKVQLLQEFDKGVEEALTLTQNHLKLLWEMTAQQFQTESRMHQDFDAKLTQVMDKITQVGGGFSNEITCITR